MEKQKHGYWMHKRIPSENYVKGYFYARECTCSVCERISMFENEVCSFCGAIMDQKEPKG